MRKQLTLVNKSKQTTTNTSKQHQPTTAIKTYKQKHNKPNNYKH